MISFPALKMRELLDVRLEDGLRNLRQEDRTIAFFFLASIATTPFFHTIYSKKFIVNGLFTGALFHICN